MLYHAPLTECHRRTVERPLTVCTKDIHNILHSERIEGSESVSESDTRQFGHKQS